MRCRLSLGLEELSIRWIQLRHAAGGDMVLMGSSPLRWRLSEGLEDRALNPRVSAPSRKQAAIWFNGRQPVWWRLSEGLEELSIRGFFGWWNIREWAVTGRRVANCKQRLGAQSDDRLQPTVLRGP